MKVEVTDIRGCPYLVLIPANSDEQRHLEITLERAESIIRDEFVEDYLSINQNGVMEINLKPLQLEPPDKEHQ
jgi:hypothetical protein